MTAFTEPAASTITRPVPPLPIVIAFYLWWFPIILQAILLAYVGLTLAEAARIGGAAWDILLIVAVPALVVVTATVVEIVGVFLLRRGQRGWRIVLLVVGLIMLWVTIPELPGPSSDRNPLFPVVTASVALILTTIGAIVVMFTPPANSYLRDHAVRATRSPAGR